MTRLVLQEALRRFQAAILNAQPDDVTGVLADNGTVDRASGFRVYIEAYRLRLYETLRDDYPVTESVAGPEGFRDVCSDYIAVHLSPEKSLASYGGDFPEFLAAHKLNRTLPWLRDIARLERVMVCALFARDEVVTGAAAQREIPPEHWPGLRIRFHPSVEMVTCAHDVLPFFGDQTHAQTSTPESLAVGVVVYREGYEVRFRSVTSAFEMAYAAASAGLSVADTCEALRAHVPDEQVPSIFASIFGSWIEDGLVVELQHESRPC